MSPDGITHRKIWRWAFPSIIIICLIFIFFGYWYLSIWILLGYLLHIAGIQNDLDLISIDSYEAFWIKTVILLPMILMSTFYARCIKGFNIHRGFLSHGPFVSTFIRLMFFSCPFLLVFRYYYPNTPLHIEFLGLFIGLFWADNLHTTFDWICGELNFFGRAGAHSKLLNWWVKKQFDFPSDAVLRKRKNKKGYRGHYYEEEN